MAAAQRGAPSSALSGNPPAATQPAPPEPRPPAAQCHPRAHRPSPHRAPDEPRQQLVKRIIALEHDLVWDSEQHKPLKIPQVGCG